MFVPNLPSLVRNIIWLSAVCTLFLLTRGTIAAQEIQTAPRPIVEDLVRRLDEQERELEYLRQRDKQHQTWEDSVADRLSPNTDHPVAMSDSAAGVNSQKPVVSATLANPKCDTCCTACGDLPCKCPQSPAPCLDCPHVSTLSPYFNLRIFGSLNGEMLFSESRPFLPSGVTLLFPDFGKDTATFEAHAKSTNIGAALAGPEILGLQSGGMFLTYLYGEQFEDDRYGFFAVRAYGDLKDENQRFVIGLDGDTINPLAPTTVNYNAGNLAGNLGFFRGQFRYERYIHFSERSQLTTQFALSNPIATSFADFDVLPANLLEDNGWPNLEGRMAWGLGEKVGPPGQAVRPIEVGVSGLVGQLRRTDIPTVPNRILDVWGFGADARMAINKSCGVKGEFFSGQCIGNYNAAILQVNNDNLDPVRSTGGWGEFYVHWNQRLHSHFGYGIDDPLDSTVTPGLLAARPVRNEFLFGNIFWDVTESLEVGFEVSHWETSYANITPVDIDNQAMMYHTRVRLKF